VVDRGGLTADVAVNPPRILPNGVRAVESARGPRLSPSLVEQSGDAAFAAESPARDAGRRDARSIEDERAASGNGCSEEEVDLGGRRALCRRSLA